MSDKRLQGALHVSLEAAQGCHQPSQFEQIVDLKISDLPCGTLVFAVCHKANPRDRLFARTVRVGGRQGGTLEVVNWEGLVDVVELLGSRKPWFRVQGSGFRDEGVGFRDQGSGFRVEGSGFRVQGLELRVQGCGFRV